MMKKKEEEEDEKSKAERMDNNNRKKKSSNEEEEPPKGYIHVRARRGQATDSHSLAERVRREKISERMKMLQRLVPGCDKVTGKALMLDEIINYVQSLQNQVEFLSMKLASVSPIFYDMATDLDNNTLLVKPEKLNIQHCSGSNNQQATTTTTTAAAVTVFPTTNNDHYLLDGSSASAFLQAQRSNIFSEGSGQFWDTEEQRQKFLHPYEFITNNLCSFH
ncbi:hypothetical protein PIB30_117908 [Stylosanthes scabra]|uniref:BHLH domain-containing protein n=1 Tax=Stylosanthes scabra TaxID=79078 RepID=A0ABU6SIP7_9FABA|nr:hypothetical protein [Stylosanthes scabra]